MSTKRTPHHFKRNDDLIVAGKSFELGETRDLHLEYSQSYTGIQVSVPVRVVRGIKPGPKVFLTALVHGDELNGLGITPLPGHHSARGSEPSKDSPGGADSGEDSTRGGQFRQCGG